MRNLLFFATLFLFTACSHEIPQIEFGKNQCAMCKMTIMDKKFGAVLVNSKGKMLKFDSGECMVSFLHEDKSFEGANYFVVNHNNPGQLMEADKAFFLKGGKVNSPMGGQLAAFESQEEATNAQKKLEGDIILWNKLVELNF